MAIITFWSNSKKQSGQTMSTLAVATYMAMEHNHKVLLLSTEYEDDVLETAFGGFVNNTSLLKSILKHPASGIDTGIEGIAKMASSNRLTPEMIQNYTKIVFKDRLEVLFAPKAGEDTTDYFKIWGLYKDILNTANRYYDLVFVDLNKGLDDENTKQILQMSNVIVVTLEQKMRRLNEFIAMRQEEPLLKGKNVLTLVNRFDKFSKYNSRNITRYLGQKREVFTVPYNTLFYESAEEGSVAEFFLRVRKVDATDKNGAFMEELKRTTDGIIYKLQELQMRI